MKTAYKIYAILIAIVYMFSLFYFPFSLKSSNQTPVNPKTENASKSADSESLLGEKAEAQSAAMIDLELKKTNELAAQSINSTRGFTKIGSIKDNAGVDTVVAVGFGSVWSFNPNNDTWTSRAAYSCDSETNGVVSVAFYQNRVWISRIGFTACGENFRQHILVVFGYVNNTLVQTYNGAKLRSQMNAIEAAVFNCGDDQTDPDPNDTCLISKSNAAGYRAKITVAGGSLYIGYLRPTFDLEGVTKGDQIEGEAKIIKVTGLVGETPNMQVLCHGGNGPINARKLCVSVSDLFGAAGGQLYTIRYLPQNDRTPFILMFSGLSTDPANFTSTDLDSPLGFAWEYNEDNTWDVDALDSYNFSDGKLRIAFSIFHTNKRHDVCEYFESNEIVTLTFTPSGTRNWANQSLIYSGKVPTGRCNNGVGYAYNGGAFVEADGKYLFGMTFCAGNSGTSANPVTACNDGNRGGAMNQLINGVWTPISMRGAEINNANTSDVRVTSMFYSTSLRRLFASNSRSVVTPAVKNLVERPAIWVQSFVAPIVNACTNLYFGTNPATTTITVNPASPTFTVTNTGNSLNLAGSGYIDIINGTKSVREKGTVTVLNATTGAYRMAATFNLEEDLRAFQDAGVTSLQVKVIVPGMGAYAPSPTCTRTITLQSYNDPTIVNPNSALQSFCSTGTQALNPYQISLRLKVAPSNSVGAVVDKVRVIVVPSNNAQSMTPNYYKFDVNGNNTVSSGGAIVVDSAITIPNTGTTNVPAFTGVTVSAKTFTKDATGNTWTLAFTLTFDSNSNYFQQYYLQPGFRYAAFVGDSTDRNNLTTTTLFGQVGGSDGVDYPLDECSALYYKTGNGDVRSFESRDIDSSGDLTPYNRLLRLTNLQGLNSQISEDTRTRLSDYSYNAASFTGSCVNYTRFGNNANFCSSVSNVLGSTQTSTLTTNLNALMTNTTVGKSTINGNISGMTTWASVDATNTSLDINIRNLPVQNINQIYIVKIQALPAGANNVRITEPLDLNSPNNVIIWCVVSACAVEINRITTVTDITVAANSQITYPTNATLNSFLLTKARLVVNNGGSVFLSSDATGQNQVNIYNAGIIAGFYVYTNTSWKTNVINGFVYSKGLVARSTGAGTANSNRYLFFRDLFDATNNQPNPIVYIEYNPKYLFVYRDIFTREAESVPRSVVGL